MSTRIRSGLGGIVNNMGRNNFSTGNNSSGRVGKVYGIVTTFNTPTKKQFERAGGYEGIGTIFYLPFNQSQNIEGNNTDEFLDTCTPAKPITFNTRNPVIGEIVPLFEFPSPSSQLSPNANQIYYGDPINTYNNPQHNSLSNTGRLGNTVVESTDSKLLLRFLGDLPIQNNKSGIRFGTTVKGLPAKEGNEWSSVGNDGDPITILVNGYVTTDTGSSAPNVEEINKELSSLYLTSTQLLPLLPDRNDILNPLTKPTPPNKYVFPQVIINSDRITLNSKKDEVMIFAKTNVEINTKNVINLNAGDRVHINSPYIFLGTDPDGTVPDEPLLLGNKTVQLLIDLTNALTQLGNDLASVVVPSQGSPLIGVNKAGTTVVDKIKLVQKKLKDITSNNTFTI
jgi:hypothetical protein